MSRHLKARYLAPALVALVMIVVGAVTSVRNTRTFHQDVKWVDQTRRVMSALDNLMTSMLNLETGYRGYAITGDEDFLEPYKSSLDDVDRSLEHLAVLTRDNPRQQERVEQIAAASRTKMAHLAKGIELRRSQGAGAVADLIATGEGRRMMDRIRGLVDSAKQEEAGLLEVRQGKMIRGFEDTRTVVVTTAAVAIVAGLTGVLLLALFLLSKAREDRLQFEKEKAEQSDKAKTEFLAMMSHEIRTPMNAILGFGELLQESVEQPREKHFAKAIVTSGRSLLSLINDILDLSKIEAAKMDLNPETVEVKRFMENLETLFSFRAEEKGLDFSVRIGPSVPAFLSFDALRLRQVLVNLIGNAVKFTREGRVTVSVRGEPAGEGDGMMLHFEVEDTGIGIAADKLREIFRPFYQVESEQGRQFQGTGLGLSISERLVTLMGGDIGARSVLGHGSTFYLRIPVRGSSHSSSPSLAADSGPADFNRLAPSKILVVDDVPLNRELIRGYLAGSHHQVIEAENSEQAVTLCLRLRPEIVLMDIRMPVVDGRSTYALLKSRPETRDIPLVAVSASSLLNSQEELKRIFDGYASKPISRERLYLELAKFLPVQSVAPTGKPVPSEPVFLLPVDRRWPDLKRPLEEWRDARVPGLLKLVPAQATAGFAGELLAVAMTHDCPPLADYARRLETAAVTMDFAEASRLLESFSGVTELLVSDA